MPRRTIGVMAVTCLLATGMLASTGVAQAAVVRPLETMCSTATINFYYHNSFGNGATMTLTARACTNGSRAYGTSLSVGVLTDGSPGTPTYGYNNPGGGSTTELAI